MSDIPRPPRKGQDPPARHLRLVQDTPRPERRPYHQRPPVFTEAETLRLRAAIRTARALFGTWGCAGAAMYVISRTLRDAATGRKPVTAEVAVRLARALGKPLDALLRPLAAAGTCATCGRRP